VFHDYLTAQGYDADDWGLEYPSQLPARQGSEYMSGLFHHPRGPHALPVPWSARATARVRTWASLSLKALGLKKR
jgi:hypothetical protein